MVSTCGLAQKPMMLPVSTYSIVARDSVTGEIGVAVQSHYFSVGPIVPWAEAGVGAVATQSLVDPSYGPLGVELMRAGRTAEEALDALVSTDDGRESRQVAMVDAQGRVAVHTGKKAIAQAGHRTGAQYSVQANLMEKPTVWDAMADAFENAEGDLAERMLRALEAAEVEGGDIRGRQSAAIVIVRETPTGRPWVDRLFDLRVEDHPQPISELRRLARLQRAYNRLGDVAAAATEDPERVLAVAKEVASLVPDGATNGEIPFWIGIDLLETGHESEALGYLSRAYGQDPRWAEVVVRLVPAGILPDDGALVDRLVRGMKQKR